MCVYIYEWERDKEVWHSLLFLLSSSKLVILPIPLLLLSLSLSCDEQTRINSPHFRFASKNLGPRYSFHCSEVLDSQHKYKLAQMSEYDLWMVWTCFFSIFLIMNPCLALHFSADTISMFSFRGNSNIHSSVKVRFSWSRQWIFLLFAGPSLCAQFLNHLWLLDVFHLHHCLLSRLWRWLLKAHDFSFNSLWILT